MDWTTTGYSYDVTVAVVHQTDVNNVLGILSGVQLSNMSISENYYSDSRVQAKLTTMVDEDDDDGYISNARLRIIVSIPSRFWSKTLFTGYVSDIDTVIESGYCKKTYTLEGTIWGLLEHKVSSSVTIAKGASLVKTWESLLKNQTKMQYSTSGSQDHLMGNTVVYEAGSNLSTILFELSSGYDRMDVDGSGVITLKKYTSPSNRTSSRIIDYKDSLGLSIAPLSAQDTAYEAPGRAIVTATINEQDAKDSTKTVSKTIVGVYDAPSSHATSINTRGWLRARSDSYSGVSETPTKAELDKLAKKNWEDNQSKGIEWTVKTVYADYHAGDVVDLVAPYISSGSKTYTHKVLISAVETDLDTFTQNLTMKEV